MKLSKVTRQCSQVIFSCIDLSANATSVVHGSGSWFTDFVINATVPENPMSLCRYTRRTPSHSEDAEGKERVHSDTTTTPSDMVVSMLVPDLTKNDTDSDKQSQSKPGPTQVFVMAFVAQSAEYVTYSCNLPSLHQHST